jgi:hypothetical protein
MRKTTKGNPNNAAMAPKNPEYTKLSQGQCEYETEGSENPGYMIGMEIMYAPNSVAITGSTRQHQKP